MQAIDLESAPAKLSIADACVFASGNDGSILMHFAEVDGHWAVALKANEPVAWWTENGATLARIVMDGELRPVVLTNDADLILKALEDVPYHCQGELLAFISERFHSPMVLR